MKLHEIVQHEPLTVHVANMLLGQGEDIWLDITGKFKFIGVISSDKWRHYGDILRISVEPTKESAKHLIKSPFTVEIRLSFQKADGSYQQKTIIQDAETFDDLFTLKKVDGKWHLLNNEYDES